MVFNLKNRFYKFFYPIYSSFNIIFIWLDRVKEFDITLRLKVSQIANKLGKHRSTVYRALEFK